ncbi:MAG TPA: 2,5-dihydroxypyridine 5,6-dioxygenase [Rhodanobacter sp.]
MNIESFDDRVALYRRELELCKVNASETVAVLTVGEGFAQRADAFAAAAQQLGAKVVRVRARPAPGTDNPMASLGINTLGQDPDAMAQLKAVDLVIDLMLLLWSKEQLEIQAAGTRILMAVDADENLERLFPSEDLRHRIEAGERRLRRARRLCFTNAAGTDISYDIEGSPVLTEYGYTDTPGRWDNWPGGLLATGARDRAVNGTVVLDRGDIIYYPVARQLDGRVTLTVADGYVTDIAGGAEAEELRRYIASYDDPRAYAVSHIGWGFNERCRWAERRPDGSTDVGMIDGRAYYGNVLFSTGPDLEIGGSNDTPCHLDMPMLGCTLWLDDEMILEQGRILPADMRVAGR